MNWRRRWESKFRRSRARQQAGRTPAGRTAADAIAGRSGSIHQQRHGIDARADRIDCWQAAPLAKRAGLTTAADAIRRGMADAAARPAARRAASDRIAAGGIEVVRSAAAVIVADGAGTSDRRPAMRNIPRRSARNLVCRRPTTISGLSKRPKNPSKSNRSIRNRPRMSGNRPQANSGRANVSARKNRANDSVAGVGADVGGAEVARIGHRRNRGRRRKAGCQPTPPRPANLGGDWRSRGRGRAHGRTRWRRRARR